MGVKWQASAANFSLRARVQRAQTRGYGVSGSRQLDLSVVQLLHLRQDQLGLGLEQRYFAAAGGAPGGPEVDDQGLAGKGRDRDGLAGAILQGELRQPIRDL